MKSTKEPPKYFRRLNGIVIPQNRDGEAAIALLNSDGQIYPILKNEKSNHLTNLKWESVSILGKFVLQDSETLLEVLYFSYDENPLNLSPARGAENSASADFSGAFAAHRKVSTF